MWVLATLALLLFRPATDYEAEGLKALDAKQYEQAAQLFSQAIQTDPKNYAAHFDLALAYSLLGKDAEAIPEYQKTLELKPGLYQAELNVGMLLVRDQRAKEATPYLDAAVETQPKEFRAQYYLADALFASGNMAAAEAHFQAAAELDLKSAAAQLGLGRVQAKQNRLTEAAEHFRKAAELDPKFNDATLEVASLFEQNHRPEDAIALYKQLPNNVAAQERVGELLMEAKKYGEAIPYLEKVVGRSPTSANRLALATAYELNQELPKGLDQLAQAVAAEPASYDLHMRYGRDLRDARHFLPAAEQFGAAAKLKPASREAWNEMAAMLNSAEQCPQALAALDRVHELGQEIPGDHYLRAIILDRLKQYQPARDAYQKFLDTSGGKNPNEEFKARQRIRMIERILSKR
jgi:tetratricopeptide (TPR) repeat protein